MTPSEHHVRRFRSRYRLPARSASVQSRLDRIARSMLDNALPVALGGAALQTELLCVRKLVVPFRMTLDGSDEVIAAEWAHALRRQLDRTLSEGRDVVRFTSPAHALVDLVLSVLHEDESRIWAYRQLALWSDEAPHAPGGWPPPVAQILTGLCHHGELIPSVLGELGQRGALPALNAAFAARDGAAARAWVLLARGALQAFGILGDVLDAAPAAVPGDSVAPEVARLLTSSSLLGRLRELPPPKGRDDAWFWARALASLTFLEMEPGALRRPGAARSNVASLASLLLERPSPLPRVVESKPFALEPLADRGEHGRLRESVVESERVREKLEVVEVRTVASTRLGGLLFLLHVVAELDLPGGAFARAPLDGRSLRWCSYRLAQALAPTEQPDPAALAFAGIGPKGVPPDDGAPAVTEAERRAISAIALDVELRACKKLGAAHDPALVRALCQRYATLFADPGWIEVRFSLDAVSTDVRRAGLDLDPGFVPWLGVVMRFSYA